MPIEFRCSQCDRLLRTADGSQGNSAKCPSCGHIMPVPAASGAGTSADIPVSTPPPPLSHSPETNPYQSPQSSLGLGRQLPPDGIPAYAMARVSGPAIGLIVLGILGLALQILGVVFLVFIVMNEGINQGEIAFQLGTQLAASGVSLTVSGVLLWGGLRMKSLRTRPLALTVSILAMIPGFSPCCFVGIPLGIWSLVVLSDPWVRAGFEASRAEATAQTPFAPTGSQRSDL